LILDTERLVNDSDYRGEMRHRFITDAFFAADLLGYKDFSPRVHGPVFNGLYFSKNPNVPITQQHSKHKRLHLDPRHAFKTTAKRIDRAQWIAAFPEEITILVESATQPLAQASAGKTAQLFYKSKNSPSKPLHIMFPEIVSSTWPELPWNTPNRRQTGAGDLDCTLAFTSPLSTQSGWHPWILEPDDVEDTKNSGISASPEVRQNIIDICDQNENLLRGGGYINICGTRYAPFDWYGRCIERAQMNPQNWEVLIRPALTLKSRERLVPGQFPEEENMDLLFPELPNLGYGELREKFYANYEAFMSQLINDPQGGAIPRFDEYAFDAAQIAPGRIPRNGEVYICWRPRYGGHRRMSKYSEGACARILDGRVYILEAWQGTWTPSGEAEKIVAALRQHEADALMVIDVPGADYLMHHVRNEALKRNRSIKMQPVAFEEENRRIAEMEQLEPMIKSGRLLFSTAMGKAFECRKQFIHFGLVEENGIIESIAKISNQVPLSLLRANMTEEELEWQRRRRDDALLSQFLEQQGYDTADEMRRNQTQAHIDAMSRTMNFRLPPLPGNLEG
jgi:hypothetical protein